MTVAEEVQEVDAELPAPLLAIRKFEKLRRYCVESLPQAVEDARRCGYNWQDIADALQLTRPSAMARYSKRINKVDLRTSDNPRRQQIVEHIRDRVRGDAP